MRIVLDTNIILISLPKLSRFRRILESLLQQKYTLVVSNEILMEYQEIITQKANRRVAENVIKMLVLLSNVEKTEIYYRWDLVQVDRDDNKFVDCAIAGNADYLVSNDKHFNVLADVRFPEVPLLKAAEFLEMLKNL